MTTEELLEQRRLKFRGIGNVGVREGVEVEPERKRNMKASELNAPKFADIESEVEDLKKTILEAKGPSDPITHQKLEKLEEDLDQEMTKAFVSMGLMDQIESLNLELARSPNPDQGLIQSLNEKADKIVQEFKRNLSRPGAYLGLKKRLQMMDIVTKILEMKENSEKLKSSLNKKLSSGIKGKMDALKRAREKLSRGDPLDKNLEEEVEDVKEKLEDVLRSANLKVVGTMKKDNMNPSHALREQMVKIDREIKQEIEKVIDEKGLGQKIDELKEEAMKDPMSEKVKKLQAEIKEAISDALSNNPLKERLENLYESSDKEMVERNLSVG